MVMKVRVILPSATYRRMFGQESIVVVTSKDKIIVVAHAIRKESSSQSVLVKDKNGGWGILSAKWKEGTKIVR